jgi:hypothetical protein
VAVVSKKIVGRWQIIQDADTTLSIMDIIKAQMSISSTLLHIANIK